ncbi:MAG: hypothetical protein GXP31_19400 [Kiritimatiellaeota bacterium]|nr:hypothetical protein [Kiritimatiellota bacterium]
MNLHRTAIASGFFLLVNAAPLQADIASDPAFLLQGVPSPYSLELGDFNNDGKLDLAVSSWVRVPGNGERYDTDRHRVLLFFQKDGKLTAPPDREIKVPSPWGLCAGDFDDDGRTDLAVKETRRSLHLFLGAENLALAHTSVDVNDSNRFVDVGRLGPGGGVDFLSGPVRRRWLGGDKFVDGYYYGPVKNDNGDACIADLDQDGNNDVVFVGGDAIRLYYGPFATTAVRTNDLSEFVEIVPPMPVLAACVGDFNGDGRPDIAAALRGDKPGERAMVIYCQRAPVGFAGNQRPDMELRGVCGTPSTADFNGDGLTDLLVSDGEGKRLFIYVQRQGQPLGTGSNDAYQTLNVPNYATVVGDLNGDGFPDLVVSDGRSGIAVLLNDGKDHPGRAVVARGPAKRVEPPVRHIPASSRTKPNAGKQSAAQKPRAASVGLDLPPPKPGPNYEDPSRMPFYTGTILPAPQRVTYKDEFFPLANTAALLGSDVRPHEPYVRELRERIERYGGKVAVVDSSAADCDCLIILGDAEAGRSLLNGRRAPDREQGYLLLSGTVDGKKAVILRGHDRLGLLWAISSFNQLVHDRDGKPLVRAADVFDYPEIPNRGFIGGQWSDGAAYCIAFKINKPVFQSGLVDFSIRDRRERRESWRNPLSRAVKEGLETLGDRLSPFGIRWYVGQNPTQCEKKIRSANDEDFKIVLGWACAAAEAGGNFCLKYDDHRFPLSPDDMRTFGSAREADAHLLNRLAAALGQRYPEARILFCPPFYWGPTSPALYPEPRDDYLFGLGNLPRNIEIFWTGPSVKSGKVTADMVKWITERIRRKPVYWQNAFGMPHMFTYHYATDPVRVYQEWFYDGFFEQVDTYMLNCMMPAYAAAAATTSDYCWNPKAYDAERSIREAATKLVGPETYAALAALNKVLSYFDPFSLRKTPGAAAKLPEMEARLAEVNAVWAEVEKRNINAVRKWTGMEHHVNQVNRFYERLRRSPDLAAYRKDAGESRKRAVAEVGFAEKTGIFLSAYDFVGGCGPKHYGLRCERRPATWIYGSRSPNPRMETTFRVEPFPPSSDYELVISGQDDDAKAKCRIRIWVNENKIFEGENPFVRYGWSRHVFRIPAAALARRNRLRIENAEDASRFGGPPFFMLNYAVVRRAK